MVGGTRSKLGEGVNTLFYGINNESALEEIRAKNHQRDLERQVKFEIKENEKMALEIIKKSVVPVSRINVGRSSVSIAENGQLRISSTAGKALTGATHVVVYFDSKTRHMQLQGVAKLPKGLTDADWYKLSESAKSHQMSFSAAGLLKFLSYDYKGSGNQSFDAATDEKTKVVSITLPEGALTPKPVTPRKKKAQVANAAAGATVAAPVAASDEEDEEDDE